MAEYCEYSKVSLYEAGEFNAKYKMDILAVAKSLIIDPDNDYVVKIKAEDTFLNNKYIYLQLKMEVVLYRVFGVYRDSVKAYRDGNFFTSEFAESKIDVKQRLALLSEWNTRMFEEKIVVPANTKIYYGIAAPQINVKSNTVYPGGAEQIIIEPSERVMIESWIKGYRFITARQLTKQPEYPLKNIDEVITSKDKLHPVLCPSCQSNLVVRNNINGYMYECGSCHLVW